MLKFWTAWKESLKWKRLEPFQKIVGMVERHWEEIVSWCKEENKVPLGFVEGLNSRIRKIQGQGYGYHDIDHMDLKILTCRLPEPPVLMVNLEEFFGSSYQAPKTQKT